MRAVVVNQQALVGNRGGQRTARPTRRTDYLWELVLHEGVEIGPVLGGGRVSLVGYSRMPGAEELSHNPEAVWWLGFVTFAAGASMCLLALLAIRPYPVTRRGLVELRMAKVFSLPA